MNLSRSYQVAETWRGIALSSERT